MTLQQARNSNIDPLALDETEEEIIDQEQRDTWDSEPLSQIPFKILQGHSEAVSGCHFCFDDARIITCSHDGTVKLWDIPNCTPVCTFDGGHTSPITECCISSDNKRLITSSWDKTVKAWDVETAKVLWTAHLAGLVTSCDISLDGKFVAAGSDVENGVLIVDATNGKYVSKLKDHHLSTVTSCRFDPDIQRVASVSADKAVKLWDMIAQKTTITLMNKHSNVISDCCFSMNGRFLCTASWDKTLLLWDIKTGKFRSSGPVILSNGHEGSVSSCVFSKDASVVVSGAYDRTVSIWDTEGECKKLTLKGHQDWVMDVAVSTDKNWILSSSKDCTIRLWNIQKSDHIRAVIETRRVMGLKIIQQQHMGRK
ncbi:WD repeat-containing protein 88 isoform X2 [Protopterus annectens]|uniref:WD repeat-containing protein 88 isoform X2 n=1 Tax=Protopterus annectens TaxID=7888 RepID=UPI001CF9A892|nr:WD repeat-containing protein 88 isoform X2 [Protopterus annectens]